ncbi:uncharacterized protein LOC122814020 isoform X2 [Protopterus annectens]|uniref:uncharacterized protein LOC122814020 isoform X2 n=1 Tax=Protopterus annectens TaxID=7888 RepID=UPI001CFB6FE7|nr:uncharacterized protein LOC122814020 isoform X2 [Protopterus annectens]
MNAKKDDRIPLSTLTGSKRIFVLDIKEEATSLDYGEEHSRNGMSSTNDAEEETGKKFLSDGDVQEEEKEVGQETFPKENAGKEEVMNTAPDLSIIKVEVEESPLSTDGHVFSNDKATASTASIRVQPNPDEEVDQQCDENQQIQPLRGMRQQSEGCQGVPSAEQHTSPSFAGKGRKLSPPFSHKEVAILVKEVTSHADELYGPDRLPLKEREKLWVAVKAILDAKGSGIVSRSVRQIKQKWDDLQRRDPQVLEVLGGAVTIGELRQKRRRQQEEFMVSSSGKRKRMTNGISSTDSWKASMLGLQNSQLLRQKKTTIRSTNRILKIQRELEWLAGREKQLSEKWPLTGLQSPLVPVVEDCASQPQVTPTQQEETRAIQADLKKLQRNVVSLQACLARLEAGQAKLEVNQCRILQLLTKLSARVRSQQNLSNAQQCHH